MWYPWTCPLLLGIGSNVSRCPVGLHCGQANQFSHPWNSSAEVSQSHRNSLTSFRQLKKRNLSSLFFFFLFQNSNLRFNSFKTHFDHEVLRILFLHPLEKRGGSVIPFLFIIKKPINPIAGLSVHFFSRDPNFSWFHVLFLWVASCPKCPTLLGKLFYLTKFISFFSLTAPTLTFLSLFCDSYFNTLMH